MQNDVNEEVSQNVAKSIKAYNPILAGQLSREEIETCSNDPNKKLNLLKKVLIDADRFDCRFS